MGILLGFVINYTSVYQTGQGSSVLESLIVEDMWVGHPTTGQIDFWLYNTGEVPITVNSIYINGVLIDSKPIPQTITLNGNVTQLAYTSPAPIPINGHAEFIESLPAGPFTLKIVTNRGSSFEQTFG